MRFRDLLMRNSDFIYTPVQPFTTSDLHVAYSRLTTEEREHIDSMIATLSGYRWNHKNTYGNNKSGLRDMGERGALELLAAIGRAINETN